MTFSWGHGAGFIAAGLLAFLADAAVLFILINGPGFNPYGARLAAIGVAMVVAYFAHRRWTFAVGEPPSFSQFRRFATVAATANAINYCIFATIIAYFPLIEPMIALVLATIVASLVSYFGFRFGVFSRSDSCRFFRAHRRS